MACNNQAANIQIEPVTVSFGRYQCQTVTTTADVASSHNNDYFVLYNALDAVKYHVWYNVGGAGVDPAPASSTAIEVEIAVGASATAVATATAAAVDAVQGFSASSLEDDVCICNTQPGLSTTVAAGVGLAGFVYTLNLAGSLDDLGLCDGDIELALDEQLLDITAHQYGTNILTSIRQGKNAEISLTLKEVDIANIKLIMKQSGSLYTPSAGTEVVGWGQSTNSENVLDKAGKLILHPVRLASSDRTRDWAFWKAHLRAESVVFSGENPMTVTCTFQCYSDDAKTDEVNLFVFGDHLQSFDDQ